MRKVRVRAGGHRRWRPEPDPRPRPGVETAEAQGRDQGAVRPDQRKGRGRDAQARRREGGRTVYDLGCGDGRIVIAAVKDFKAKKGLGVDFNPERLKDCEERMDKDEKLTAEQKKTLTFKQGDVLKMTPEDFKDVDVVTLYLLPDVNLRLKPMLQKGLKPGARVVSHDFDMGEDWKADKKEEVEDRPRLRHTVYLWTIKEQEVALPGDGLA